MLDGTLETGREDKERGETLPQKSMPPSAVLAPSPVIADDPPRPRVLVDRELIERCFARGSQFDLGHCVYGHAHAGQGDTFSDVVEPYYVFLAGLMHELGVTQVAELGTHFGGSIQAMLAGVPSPLPRRFASVDVTRLNRDQLEQHPGLTLVQGDALDPAIVARMLDVFDRHIDVLYVDTIHSFAQTLENTAVYANRLKPRVILFDDIHLNEEMRRFWAFVQTCGAGQTFDVTKDAQRGAAGFGLLVCRYPFRWPEASNRRRQLMRAAFAARLKMSLLLTYDQKTKLRALLRKPTRL